MTIAPQDPVPAVATPEAKLEPKAKEAKAAPAKPTKAEATAAKTKPANAKALEKKPAEAPTSAQADAPPPPPQNKALMPSRRSGETSTDDKPEAQSAFGSKSVDVGGGG